MDIITEKIYMNKVKNKNTYQLTVDDDFIVSDTKPDMDKVIREQGEVIVDEYKISSDKIDIRGRLKFDILYLTNVDTGFLNNITEIIPFKETINLPGVKSDSLVHVKAALEDLAINIINSRKISVKGLITLFITEEEIYGRDIIVNVQEDIQTKKDIINLTQLITNKKDIYRIKEEILLQSSKKNIKEILYYDISLINTNTRILNEKIGIKGDIIVFVLYSTEDDEYECIEKEIPYSGEIELEEAREDMIEDVDVKILNKEIVYKNDPDGEARIIDIDVTLDLNMKIYKEDKVNIVKDMYSTKKYIDLNVENMEFMNLLIKNATSVRLDEKLYLKNEENSVLQICKSLANVNIDDIAIVDNGINVEGAVEVNVLYIASSDKEPMNSFKEIIPFSHIIEIQNINEECIYDIKPCVEHINVTMLTGTELEVKIAINLATIVFEKTIEDIITDVEEREFTKEELKNRGAMIGHRVKDNEDIWDIARKYYTTVDMLKEVNKIVDKEIRKGDRLLIVRE